MAESKTPQVVQDNKKRNEVLNEKIKEYLLYAGFAGAAVSIVAYIIITITMIQGFSTNFGVANYITFSVIGFVVGMSITINLLMQGIAFAKREEESQRIMKEYYEAVNTEKEEKELHQIEYYLRKAIMQNAIFKGSSVLLSTFFTLYIFIEGNGNWALLGLALSNIFMFTSFGLIGLSTMYDKYIEEHLVIVQEQTKRIKERNAQIDNSVIDKMPIPETTLDIESNNIECKEELK